MKIKKIVLNNQEQMHDDYEDSLETKNDLLIDRIHEISSKDN